MLTTILIGFVLLPLLVTGSIAVVAEPPAGVIAWTCHNKQALVLLAYDVGPNRNGWAAFGGHGEEGERIVDTAAREFREETRCAFEKPSAEDLLDQKRSSVGPFYSYGWQVDYVPAINIEKARCGTVGERKKFMWVTAADLSHAVHKGEDVTAVETGFDAPSDRKYPLWFAGSLALQQAMHDGVLPEDNSLCQ